MLNFYNIDFEVLFEKIANKNNSKRQEKSRLKEEVPTRKSGRVRNTAIPGNNLCTLAALNGSSIYCEDDKDLENFIYKDEDELLISMLNAGNENK